MTHPTRLHTGTQLVAVASGKGGVGKTSLTLNLACLLAKKGKNVLVFDGDTGLANLDVQLNLKPEHDLADVVAGTHTLESIRLGTPHGFTLIPGRAGAATMANLPLPTLHNLLASLRELAKQYDVVLLDVAAGVDATALTLCAQADATLLVTTPDPSSLTDAYALIKLLWQQHGVANTRILVNQANPREGTQTHKRLTTAAENFLSLPPLLHAATIPTDKNYQSAVRMHQIAAIAFPTTPAITALESLIPTL